MQDPKSEAPMDHVEDLAEDFFGSDDYKCLASQDNVPDVALGMTNTDDASCPEYQQQVIIPFGLLLYFNFHLSENGAYLAYYYLSLFSCLASEC